MVLLDSRALKKNIAAVRQAAEATAAPVAPPKPVTDEDDDDDLFGFGNIPLKYRTLFL